MYKYILVPIYSVEPEKVEEYWRDVKDNGLLKYRLPDVLNPTVKSAMDMVVRMYRSCFAVLSSEKKMVGECTLENFQGQCAMVHFSMHPSQRGKAVQVAKEAAEQLFLLKRSTDPDVPYVSSLIGLTPVSNKLAVRFIKAVGYKPIAVLKKAYWLSYKNAFDDGLMTILEAPGGER